MGREFRLDELARRGKVASTTVRLYQSKGPLPPPRLEGRTGWYDESHLSRLRLIARLQAEGHSLVGIGNLLEQWETGSLNAVIVSKPSSTRCWPTFTPPRLTPRTCAPASPPAR
jgi:DNA-binding transcriptional MerR regulator